jgi:hypothetical protein
MKRLIYLVPLLMVGCASQNDVTLNNNHMLAEIEIAQWKSKAISDKAAAIQATIGPDASELERYLAREQISRMEVTVSGIKSPTLGTDVQVRGLETAEKGIVPIAFAIPMYKSIKEQKGDITATVGRDGSINVIDDDKRATTFGQGSPATNQPGYKEPEKAESSTDWASIPGCSSLESFEAGKCAVQPE